MLGVEAGESAHRSGSVCWGVESSHPEAEAGPVIDVPIISALPPPPLTIEWAEEILHPDGFGGQGSLDRTLTGSDTQKARTPTRLQLLFLPVPAETMIAKSLNERGARPFEPLTLTPILVLLRRVAKLLRLVVNVLGPCEMGHQTS